MPVCFRSVPGAIGNGDPRDIKQYLEDHGVKCWIDVERIGQVSRELSALTLYILMNSSLWLNTIT